MKNKMKKILLSAVIITPALISACGGGGGGGGEQPAPVVPPTQTINNFVIPALAVRASVSVSTMATSGLPVSFTSSTPSVCSVSGSTVTGVSFGTCTITATQNGNTSVPAAPTVSSSVVVGAQVIDFRLPSLIVGESFPLTATSSSKLALSFTSTTPSVCTVNGFALTAVSAASGSCIIQATQAGNSQYAPATPISVSTRVDAASLIVVPGTVPPPSTFPQVGSTGADSTATLEGIYAGGYDSVALIDASRNIAYFDANGMLFGLLQVSGLNWNLDSSSVHYGADFAEYATANGTFTTKAAFIATSQSFLTSPSPLSFNYDISNGFAVRQSNVAGNWVLNQGNAKFQISISNTGVVTGTYTENGSLCGISGSLMHANPSKSHNMFNVSLRGANIPNSGATCDMDTGNFQGLAAIRFLKATSNFENGFIPALVVIVRTSTHANVWFTLYQQY